MHVIKDMQYCSCKLAYCEKAQGGTHTSATHGATIAQSKKNCNTV